MFEYILRLLILLPLVGGMAWGSLWLWKRVQMGVPLVGGATKTRAIEMVDVLQLGPGSKLAVVEFAGQRVLIAGPGNCINRIAEDCHGALPERGGTCRRERGRTYGEHRVVPVVL